MLLTLLSTLLPHRSKMPSKGERAPPCLLDGDVAVFFSGNGQYPVFAELELDARAPFRFGKAALKCPRTDPNVRGVAGAGAGAGAGAERTGATLNASGSGANCGAGCGAACTCAPAGEAAAPAAASSPSAEARAQAMAPWAGAGAGAGAGFASAAKARAAHDTTVAVDIVAYRIPPKSQFDADCPPALLETRAWAVLGRSVESTCAAWLHMCVSVRW